MCKKKTLHPVHQHVIYILQSVTEPSDQIAEQILHALHTSAVSTHVWWLCLHDKQQRAEPGEEGMLDGDTTADGKKSMHELTRLYEWNHVSVTRCICFSCFLVNKGTAESKLKQIYFDCIKKPL